MSKREAEWCKRIDIWWLLKGIKGGYRRSIVSWGEDDDKSSIGVVVNIGEAERYIQFRYSITENQEKKNFDYKVYIVTTPCHLGGERFWFVCPLTKEGVPCNRRIAVLYQGGEYFGCRHCYDLTYRSKNRTKNGKYSYFTNFFDSEEELEKIESKKFNRFYKGEPTKKQKRIEKLQEKRSNAYRTFELQEKGIKGRVVGNKIK